MKEAEESPRPQTQAAAASDEADAEKQERVRAAAMAAAAEQEAVGEEGGVDKALSVASDLRKRKLRVALDQGLLNEEQCALILPAKPGSSRALEPIDPFDAHARL
eukprot:COSAG05_NODE_1599_length_4452_cov_2.249024_4_plen_105_part_00